MKTDSAVLSTIAYAFAACERPVRFLPDVGDPEFEDHEALLQSRALETLEQKDLSPGYDAFVYCSPAGLAHFLPALASFALHEPRDALDWFGPQLIFHLSPRESHDWLASHCNANQIRAVVEFLEHLQAAKLNLVQGSYAESELENCLAAWRGISR